ncbi:hypothetical protein [Micromonospora aurantiaca (nom. illeg.)]|uniref:hypothetical protein n=1 Tax=Micromonospora aurantiaca (nom. illeg.) TaxID=47850 RepID=UPI0036B93179
MQSPSPTGIVVLVAVLAAATAFGWWRRRHDGRLRAVRKRPPATDAPHRATLTALGVRPGEVTLVQFSAPVCAPCRAARRVLADVPPASTGSRCWRWAWTNTSTRPGNWTCGVPRRCWWWTPQAASCAGPPACPTATT